MPVIEVGLCLLAMVVAVAVCAVLTAAGQWLGNLARPDRLTRKDQRWLAQQAPDDDGR